MKRRGSYRSKRSPKDLSEWYLFKLKHKDARKRGKTWEISLGIFLGLIYANCTYCGTPPATTVNPTNGHNLAESRATECFITYNGIDRVDSSKGYILGNVVTCCEHCNKAKLARSVEDFKAWITKVYLHLNKP